jgi:hypothetical protein
MDVRGESLRIGEGAGTAGLTVDAGLEMMALGGELSTNP